MHVYFRSVAGTTKFEYEIHKNVYVYLYIWSLLLVEYMCMYTQHACASQHLLEKETKIILWGQIQTIMENFTVYLLSPMAAGRCTPEVPHISTGSMQHAAHVIAPCLVNTRVELILLHVLSKKVQLFTSILNFFWRRRGCNHQVMMLISLLFSCDHCAVVQS